MLNKENIDIKSTEESKKIKKNRFKSFFSEFFELAIWDSTLNLFPILFGFIFDVLSGLLEIIISLF
jgi:hypothetical protein